MSVVFHIRSQLSSGSVLEALELLARHGEAVIETERLEVGDVAVQDRREQLLVQKADVVALVKGIDEDLPVHRLRDDALVVERPAAETVRGQLRPEPAEPGVDVEAVSRVRRRRRDHPHEAVLLAQRQLGERAALGAHAGEAALVGNAHHLAGQIVRPGMIGAGEDAGFAATLSHLGAAVPAHVEEGAQLAVAVARDQDRHAGIIVGAKGAGPGPLRCKAHQQRVLAKQDRLLARQMLRIRVDSHVVAPGRIGQMRGLGIDVVSAAASRGRSAFAGSSRTPVHLCRNAATHVQVLTAKSLIARLASGIRV